MNENAERIKCLIIGSGPAGYTAAIYAARADLNPVLYEGPEKGGQLTKTLDVDNFPGYPEGAKGTDIMNDLRKQALRFNTDIRAGIITSVDLLSGRPFKVVVGKDKTILADSIIIATGASAKWLGLESERKYKGFGVSACVHCDGFLFKGKIVAVVGGGDTAAEEAMYLAKLCKKVYLIVRRDQLRALKTLQHEIVNTSNIEIIWNHKPKEIIGEERGFSRAVTGIVLTNVETNEERILDINGIFVAIGHTPNTEFFKGQLNLDPNGYIITHPGTTKTDIEGVFAAGDVQDRKYRQAITAAGTGCMAAMEVEKYLSAL